jgi:putative sigma-54 modulation protein
MTSLNPPALSLAHDRLLLRGVHLDLTDALRAYAVKKTARLLRHNARIIRVRIDLEHDHTAAIGRQFIAKGHIEIGGPDLLASVAGDDLYSAIGTMVDTLARLLRRRHGRQLKRQPGIPGLATALQAQVF